MRRSFIVFVLLAALAAGGLLHTHVLLRTQQEEVRYQEELLTGDLSAAEGLRAHWQVEHWRQLFWDITLPLGHEPETEFCLLHKPKEDVYEQELRPWEDDNIQLYGGTSMGIAGSLEPPYEQLGWAGRVVEEYADQVPAGSAMDFTVTISDYTDSYPVSVDVNYGGEYLSDHELHFFYEPGESIPRKYRFLAELAERFAFPVGEEEAVVTIGKDPMGHVEQVNCSGTGEESVWIESQSVGTPEYIYFVVEAREDISRELLDYSGTPEGYGIYRIRSDGEFLSADAVELVRPLPEDWQIRFLCRGDEGELLMLTEEKGGSVIRVLDAETCGTLQTIPLEAAEEGQENYHLRYRPEGLLVNLGGETLRFYEKDSRGQYVPRVTCTPPEDRRFAGLSYFSGTDLQYCYDGERLAILSPIETDTESQYSLYWTPAFCLMVADSEKTLYAGAWYSSLMVRSAYNSCRVIPAYTELSWT